MDFNDTEERKAMLAAIIDSSEDAIISKDTNSCITSWNKSAERMFGYTEAEAVGKHIYILIPTERRHEEDTIMSELRRGNRIEHFETIRVTKSGQQLNISLTISPIKNAEGRLVGASKIARDITRQKKDEEVIRQYAQRLEVINSVSKAISTQMDEKIILQKVTDATTSLSNAAFGAFFYNKLDAKGETYMLYSLSGAPREAFEKFGMPRNTAVFKSTFDGDGIVRVDDITKDPHYGKNYPHHGMPEGHLPVVSYLAVPVMSQTGIVIGGLFFGHPEPGKFTYEHEVLVSAIASQSAIALDNAKLYEEVQALNAKKDEFIGFASHELKTPLTTLSGYIQLAEQLPQLPDQFLTKIRKQVERLSGIIADLLDISKIQAGKMEMVFSKVKLNGLVQESIESINFGSHHFILELPKEDIFINVDAQKISQVLTNLLTNAVKYSLPETTITVFASLIGDEIQIAVKDQGMGIAADNLDKIFNRYYRVSQSAKAEGIGLGLYICHEIMESHFGRIWVDSEQGKGSTFFIEFPIDKTKIDT